MRLTSVYLPVALVLGGPMIAVGVLDNENVGVLLAVKTRNTGISLRQPPPWRLADHDVEIFISERDFLVIDNKGRPLEISAH
jgi:hypothetical protein